ncbi:FkbM family methyltransferase [Actinomadura sp. 21ATH]|uniref:FkbM family methyltransferase n=1 Tax=Actinomadura sp. 21ATH TaxID=1735444 RepID=UPI0035BF4482
MHIYDDASPRPDPALARRLAALGCRLRRAPANHGKRRWWQWWNTILADLRSDLETARDDGPILVLQDDVRLCHGFAERALRLFAGIDDPAKATLHLHLTAERSALGASGWTAVRAVEFGDVVRSGWVDMSAFLAHPRLFAALGWRLDPVPAARWDRDDLLSSGVGEQISRRAHAVGLGMYQVRRSLAVHDESRSRMNPSARVRQPMRTTAFVEGDAAAARLAASRPAVLASLASIPARADGLRQVVERLRPQVDELVVYLNGYDRVPGFLDGVTTVRSQDHGDRGDAGKFFPAGRHTGVHVVCDDDIAYPPDYVDALLDGIRRHGRRAVVGFHASTFREPFTSYHRSRSISHMSRAVPEDVAVHVLGTATAAYHTSTIIVRDRDFPVPNLADVWFALLGQRQRVPFVQLRREAGWLTELPGPDGAPYEGLYARGRRGSVEGDRTSPETRAVLSHQPWTLSSRTAVHPAAAGPPAIGEPPGRLVRVRVRGPAHDAVLLLPEDDHITLAVQRTGSYYERDLLDAVSATGARGVFVDVGAHYGNHTAFFAIECGERVIAVEPARDAVAGLRATLAENGIQDRVEVRPVGVHPSARRLAPLPIGWRPDGRPGTARTNTGARRFGPDDDGDVEALPLDDVLAGTDGVGLIKVDAGGLSGEILGSGRRMLRRDRPVVVAAAGTDDERTAVRGVLEPLGYACAGRYGWTPTWLWSPRRTPG